MQVPLGTFSSTETKRNYFGRKCRLSDECFHAAFGASALQNVVDA
jgi:hypothetical protein